VEAVQVPERSPAGRGAVGLTGRGAECAALDRLAEAVRSGQSRALVVHGEAGVGKTALLDYLAGHAPGLRVARAAGVESEMELAFAGLHQLCAPMLDRLDGLPVPQREALGTAFGTSRGRTPDRFLVGLAVLGLLSEAGAEQPLLCLVDDGQWLDHTSAQVLAFVARRLDAESVGLVFATRVPGGDLDRLPDLAVAGLREADARRLLDAVLPGTIDARIRDQLIAETRGNPLALLELPLALTPAQLAGGFGRPGAAHIEGRLEESFRRHLDTLPAQTRRLLLLAAADPSGDTALVWRAAARLGIGSEAAAPATEAGLAEFGPRLRFRHPLVRSAAYQSARALDRREAHRVLAEATDPHLDPDRRAWHRAQAAAGPDEEVAAELERSAGRARARGGLGAAAAFLKQAATLTLDPGRRAARALAAAQFKIQAGAFGVAADLLDLAETGPLSDVQQAHADVARAQLAFVTSRGSEAPPLLVKAAGRLKASDPGLARETYLDALSAAIFAGRLATPGSGILEVALAASGAPPAQAPPRVADLLLDGLVAHYCDGYSAGVPLLRQALAAFQADLPAGEQMHWLWLACVAGAFRVWDDERLDALSARHVQLTRDTGALSELPLALTSRAYMLLFAGQLAGAAALIDEAETAKDATGTGLAPYGSMGLAALSGDEGRAVALIEETIADATRRGEGVGITIGRWAGAALHNGLGRYDQALAAAQLACGYEDDLGSLLWATVELIEAAARCGATEAGAVALARLKEMTRATDTDWGQGIWARSRALLAAGEEAEALYTEAITRLGRTRIRVDLARAHLLYGEWLRRERRRGHAREQLRTAHGMLSGMGVAAFAERARRELRATGETAHQRTFTTAGAELTAQEAQIARLARDGLSNPEIGSRLFISPHTVQYHLRKVFAKLGISSRSQLDRVLPGGPAGL
jgi:DNA-binding CsgD family transcriptional regulator